jgi:hypothetical protein
MKNCFFIFLFSALCSVSFHSALSQVPKIEWQKSYGGNNADRAASVVQTFDGGYIVAGNSASNNGDISGNHGDIDACIVKISSTGSIEWQKSIGGSGSDLANSVVQTKDSGYIFCGYTTSNDGDVSGNHGSNDIWVVKLSASGSILWQKCYGGTEDDGAFSIQQTTDGEYIIGGYSFSKDGDVTVNQGWIDLWVIKIDAVGTLLWQKSFGGSGDDFSNKILQTADGGYIVAGTTGSNDGDVVGHHSGYDIWLLKLSDLGVLEWQKCLGGYSYDVGEDVIQTNDGGYAVAGTVASSDGDVSGNNGRLDYWVARLSPLGDIMWQLPFGGAGDDWATSILQSVDNGFMVAGYSNSELIGVTGIMDNDDCWLLKINASGSIDWLKNLGGSKSDGAYCITKSSDGGYLLACSSISSDRDVTFNHGSSDIWIVKFKNTLGMPQLSPNDQININPNPTTNTINISGAENATVRIYSTFGQLVKEAQNTSEISLADLPAAMYFIRVFNDQGEMIHCSKVVKQ